MPSANPVVLAPDPMSGAALPVADSGGAMDISDLLRGGDTLIIRLTGVRVPDQGIFEVKIDEGGKISMPHIGSLVAANTTTVQLKKLIESTYIKEEIFTNPNVTVDPWGPSPPAEALLTLRTDGESDSPKEGSLRNSTPRRFRPTKVGISDSDPTIRFKWTGVFSEAKNWFVWGDF
ncbi:MAG: polysaccharide biosynthesis/export family protein [Verrucomicrobia bacterium]|nr:polysaccharide biosynthesis/export family protein [Verrucomicrobiota bacterium]